MWEFQALWLHGFNSVVAAKQPQDMKRHRRAACSLNFIYTLGSKLDLASDTHLVTLALKDVCHRSLRMATEFREEELGEGRRDTR